MAEDVANARIGRHGAARLAAVDIDSYNLELKDDDGFLGDRASKGAFQAILDGWRKPLKKAGDDPFGNKSSEDISKKELDKILVSDDVEAAAVVHSAVEGFAQEFAGVVSRFLKLKSWANTERIIVGGGFRQSRLGELAIARA
ncbi:MAG: ROK family protein, partial [Bradyrhizobium sp.]|nr:ROK family protein [Bradyrhizobium sp.]